MAAASPNEGTEGRIARIALTWLTEPGNRAVWHLVEREGPEEALSQLLSGGAPDATLRAAVLARTSVHDPRRVAEAFLRRGERAGARVIVPSDPEWPARLGALAGLETDEPRSIGRDVRPPLCLWVRGKLHLDETLERSVGVVGARAASQYGMRVGEDLAYGLAEQEWTVLSGGAYGIDTAAHRAALAAGGRTVAVLACGIDKPYPTGNARLFEQIVASGLMMTEWPPGAEPLRHRFLIRNRVIAAVTAGTVVVEAAARSGAAQTMSRVVALNRPAMVVPGPITSATSVGCHELLRRHPSARVVTNVAEILDEVGHIGEYLAPPPRAANHPRDDLDEESALVLEAVPRRGAASPEELATRAGLALRTVLRRLSLLETLGLVRNKPEGVVLTGQARRATPRTEAFPQ